MTHYYGTDEDETFKLYLEETLSNVQEVVPVLAKEVPLTSDIQLKAHSMPYLVSVSEKTITCFSATSLCKWAESVHRY